jgi:hypothetical protein
MVAATVEYSIGARVWTHRFTGRLLNDAEMRTLLAEAGLALIDV